MELQMTQGAFPLLSLMVAVPAVAAALIWLVPALRVHGRTVALVTSAIEAILVLVVAFQFDWSASSSYQFFESAQWIPAIGISWSLAVNALGLVMILLSALLVPLVLLASPAGTSLGEREREGGYGALILLLYAFIVLIFSAFDVIVFYLAFEAMLLPLFFMIGRFGHGENPRHAAMKFLIYSLVGGLAMLGGIVTIFGLVGDGMGGHLFRYDTLAGLLPGATIGVQMAVFITFMIAFAIKAPMVPVHTWLPDTAAAARPGTSVLLVGILDKIGTFGMIVLCLSFVPDAAYAARWTIIVLAVISILWGGFAANGQKDLLRLVSFTSVSHFGFIVLGVFIGSEIALTGAMFYMVAHGLSVAALFLISGFLIERGDSQKISRYRGMQRITPVIAGTWLFAGMATIALPGLSGFVPEYLVLIGTYSVSIPTAIFAVFGVVLAAMYILWPYQKMFTGPKEVSLEGVPDMTGLQKVVVAPLLVGMLVLGIWSAPLVGSMTQISEDSPIAQDLAAAAVDTADEGN